MSEDFMVDRPEEPVEDWRARFPNMTPIKSPPGMLTINSIGTRLWGQRDEDAETGSYVSTLCFVILFLPVLPIRAYRIINAPNGGYYFLGREPLSSFAKTWNLLVLGFVAFMVLLGMVNERLNSPERRAERLLAESRDLQSEGQSAKAWSSACQSYSLNPAAKESLTWLQQLYKTELPKSTLAELVPILEVPQLRPSAIADDEAWAALGWAALKAQKEKATAALVHRICAASGKLQVERGRWLENADSVLREVLAVKPEAEIAIELALLLEERRDSAAIREVLEPYRDKLGAGEGARMLGLVALAEGRNDEALTLLEPYLQKNLARLKNADQELHQISEAVWDEELKRLQAGRGPREMYRKELSDEARSEMAQNHLVAHLNNSPRVKQARQNLQAAADLAPLSLQLGVLYMDRGRDPNRSEADRRKDLERAEGTLLAIGGVASSSPEYQLSLGQVTGWLGKNTESEAAFRRFLELQGESAAAMLQVASTLRELGQIERARFYGQEAYEKADQNKGKDDEAKFGAAYLLAIISQAAEQRQQWLERSDPKAPPVQASLAEARATKALENGNKDAALRSLRAAAKIYAGLQEDPVVLNNLAIVMTRIYGLAFRRADLVGAAQAYEKAVALAPTRAILVWNAAHSELPLGLTELLADEIPFESLEMEADLCAPYCLFKDEAGRQVWRERFLSQARINKAKELCLRSQTLMPNNPGPMRTLAELYSFGRDDKALAELAERAAAATFDQSPDWTAALAGYDGPDAESLTNVNRQIDLLQKVLERQAPDSRALALAKLRKATLLLTRHQMSRREPLDEALKLTRESHASCPSTTSGSVLQGLLIAMAIDRAVEGDEALSAWLLENRHLPPVPCLYYLLLHRPALRDSVLAMDIVQEYLRLAEAHIAAFKDSATVWAWALFGTFERESAKVVAERLKSLPRIALKQKLDDLLSPMSLMTVLERDLLDRCLGQRQPERLLQAQKQGLPIPEEALR